MNRSNAGSLPSVEELMEQYAALVWKTAAAYLKNPEDIKECVNDTFLEFYLHSDRYDPKKGSYAAFLCTIARRKAVSIYRKNRKGSGFSVLSGEREGRAATAAPADMAEPEDMADPADVEEAVAGRLDLEAALQSLKPEEFDIIRMKYYDGMTIKEIADSLNLSYETVKKRHQRSLTKLQKALTIGLILALIAALAACAYVVLRYFGIVPGYGVNATFEGERVYVGNKRLMDRQKVLCDEVSRDGTVVYVAIGKKYAGYIVIADSVKEDAKTTLQYLKEKCKAVLVMLTGDTKSSSLEVARKLKIDYAYAELMPEDKLEQLEDFLDLQDSTERLVCVGDGINDAPVLARADVGIAMGALGSAAAIEAADIILMEDELPRIVDAIKIAKETLRVVSQNISFALIVKVLILILATIGYFGMWEAILAEVGVMFAAILNAVWVVRYTV